MISIHEMVRRHAMKDPDAPAFTRAAGDEIVSYEALYRSMAGLTAWLKEADVVAGTCVVYFVESHWLFFSLLGACAALGARLVPLSPRLHPRQIVTLFRHCDPRVVISQDEATPRNGLSAQARVVAEADLRNESLRRAATASLDPIPVADGLDRVCLMLYTSGTTGTPKGVLLTQDNLLAMASDFLEVYRIAPADRLYSVLPVHHGNAVNVTGVIPLVAGAHTVLGNGFDLSTAYGYWEEMAQREMTICSLTPSLMALLLRLARDRPAVVPFRVRFAFCGGAALPADLWRDFEATFGIPVHQGYGLTETTFWIACVPPDERRKYDTVGLPVRNAEVRIQPLPAGETIDGTVEDARPGTGEVWVRGPMVTPGYFRGQHPANTCLTDDGFLRTGDLGFFDEQGQLHISGRIKDIIKRKAANIVPEDIDCVLLQCDAIGECKTIGTPDPMLGERVVSVCVPKEGIARAEVAPRVRAFARQNLPANLQPDAVFVLGHLPRSVTGKISSAILRDIVTLELSRKVVERLLARRYCRFRSAETAPLVERIQAALVGEGVVPFVMLWGCGDKAAIDRNDTLALDRLGELLNEVQIIPQLRGRLTLLMTDLHARFNGYADAHVMGYMKQVEERARALGIDVGYESEVWRRHELQSSAAAGMFQTAEFERSWERTEIRERLVRQAAKHSKLPPVDGARTYLATCLWERGALSREFAGAILLTYSGPENDFLVPDLPRIHLFPHKRGLTDKPWFQ